MSQTKSMTTYILKDTSKGNEREFETEDEAKERKQELQGLGASAADLEIVEKNAEADGESETEDESPAMPEDGKPTKTSATHPEEFDEQAKEPTEIGKVPESAENDALDDLGDELDTDPLSILPDHMIDEIKGTPAVNKRGYAMIAERYGIETAAEVVEFPWDNDQGRCVARATARTEDGKEYSGWATASKQDGDMADQLIELAETRALKRSVSWASGVGIVSYHELQGELE